VVRKLLFLTVLFSFLFSSCQQKKDRVVAQVYSHKLYASEVQKQLPSGMPTDDSLAFATRFIDSWISDQLLLAEAEKALSMRDKQFQKEMSEYRNSLIRSKYMEKITADTNSFYVTDEEVRATIAQARTNFVNEKEIVRLNYVKVSAKSPVKEKVKEILFDEEKRLLEKEKLTELCADSIEYFVDDDTWLFWDDIQLEVDIDLQISAGTFNQPQYIEKTSGESCYLIVILDYKSEQTGADSRDYFESVRTMLIQKKKNEYINQKLDELYLKAEKAGKIAR
jgi:hypothetical protein